MRGGGRRAPAPVAPRVAPRRESPAARRDAAPGRSSHDGAARGGAGGAGVARALAEQHGLEFVDLVHVDVDPSALSLLPEKLARRYEALPIRLLDDQTVLIAVADPTTVRP